MFGKFQQSQIRIEVPASHQQIEDSLLKTAELKKWLWFEQFSLGLPEKLQPGLNFTSSMGLVKVQHQVEAADDHRLMLLLSGGIDGYHEWLWGDGWVQSDLEGISLLPLNLAQTFGLLQLKQFLALKQ